MSTVRQIHQEAMAKFQLANAALAEGDRNVFENTLHDAYLLERQAAEMLAYEYESEPTRSVLFRSAASIAINMGLYSDAIELIESALGGVPHPEIKEELIFLLDEVNERAIHEYPALGFGNTDIVIIASKGYPMIARAENQALQLEEARTGMQLSGQSLHWLRLNESLRKAYEKYTGGTVVNQGRVQSSIDSYLQSKHVLLSQAIGKPDTQAVWYSVEFLRMLSGAITELGADGVRFYLCAYEETHPAYAMQTCLQAVLTRAATYGPNRNVIHENIIMEEQPDFVERLYLNDNYAMPQISTSNELINVRVKNYRSRLLPLLNQAIGKDDTTVFWYPKLFINTMLNALYRLNANGVSFCFGVVEDGDDAARTSLVLVPTRLQNDGSISMVEDSGAFGAHFGGVIETVTDEIFS
jgi:hypothetical protein